MPKNMETTERSNSRDTEKLFTVAEANRSLVLVRRIVQDIVGHYHRLLALRDERAEKMSAPGHSARLNDIDAQLGEAVDTLNALHGELSEIGCVLKDWSQGLVDFPGMRDDRKIWLCWKLGEERVEHWHELHAGMAGRQRLEPSTA